jgi:hypothetical protein
VTTIVDRTVQVLLGQKHVTEHVQLVGIILLIVLLVEHETLRIMGSRSTTAIRIVIGPLLVVFVVVVVGRALALR